MWRYQLMKLSAKGTVYDQASGSVEYLRLLAAGRAVTTRGRQWIARSDQPATLQPSAAYRITQHVLRRSTDRPDASADHGGKI